MNRSRMLSVFLVGVVVAGCWAARVAGQTQPPSRPGLPVVPDASVIVHEERPPSATHFPDEPEVNRNRARRRRDVDSARARQDAQELAALAQKVPAEVEQLSKNVLPKDLLGQLKRIQKLAKRLRDEVSPELRLEAPVIDATQPASMPGLSRRDQPRP